jgi:hypothetical protein
MDPVFGEKNPIFLKKNPFYFLNPFFPKKKHWGKN